jgi:hypothetical protein
MNKFLFAMTALGAIAAAAPAAAQSGYGSNGYNSSSQYNQGQYNQSQYNQDRYNQDRDNQGQYNQGQYGTNGYGQANVDSRLALLDARIQAGIDSGAIDQREAWSLRQQLSDISRLDQRYSRNGYTAAEQQDLQRRLRAFRDQLASADGGARGYGSGQYGRNNGNYGQGGPYEDAACSGGGYGSSRGGLGGLIDSIFGGSDGGYDNCTTLGVGARVSGNLGAVPYEYRSQYRDGYGYTYRSDGRAIYQIDTRTNTVLRVYPMNR